MLHKILLYCINHFFHRPQQDESQLSSGQTHRYRIPEHTPPNTETPSFSRAPWTGESLAEAAQRHSGSSARNTWGPGIPASEKRCETSVASTNFQNMSNYTCPPFPPPPFSLAAELALQDLFPFSWDPFPRPKPRSGKEGHAEGGATFFLVFRWWGKMGGGV